MNEKCGICGQKQELTKHIILKKRVCKPCITEASKRALATKCVKCNKLMLKNSRSNSWFHKACEDSGKPFEGY